MVFFAYIGFDAVSTAAQEAKNPQKDMPIGILGSLVICTILYILVSGLLTGMVSYTKLSVPDPVAVGIDVAGISWGSFLVKIGAIFGLGTVMLVMLLGQSRVFYSMSRDGLLGSGPAPSILASGRHGFPTLLWGFCCDFRRGDSDCRSQHAGQHRNAAGVCDCLRRGLGASRAPPGPGTALQNPMGPAGADTWHCSFARSYGQLAGENVVPADWLADHRDGHLLYLWTET